MMTSVDIARPDQKNETKMLNMVYSLCVAAQRFFQQAAHQVDDSNLRYKFLELSTLHSNAARHLPEPANTEPSQDVSSELVAVRFWYLHQQATLHQQLPQRPMLEELAGLLEQQLLALKRLTKRVHNHTAKVTLAHLSAALQIANDQLMPLLKVLPVSTKKIQTKN